MGVLVPTLLLLSFAVSCYLLWRGSPERNVFVSLRWLKHDYCAITFSRFGREYEVHGSCTVYHYAPSGQRCGTPQEVWLNRHWKRELGEAARAKVERCRTCSGSSRA